MNKKAEEYLTRIAQEGSTVYTRSLAASERAVLMGQFNLSKVLRTTGHSRRVQALNALRLLDESFEPSRFLDSGQSSVTTFSEASNGGNTQDLDSRVEEFMQRTEIVAEATASLLDRARRSYNTHGEVFDDDVATGYLVCSDCGMILAVTGTDEPESCSLCGAPRIDLEWFGPFYLTTAERLLPRTPSEVVSILEETPGLIENSLLSRDEKLLSTRPSEKEWCVKEIVGHIHDVEDLFLHRITPILDSDEEVSLPVTGAPWTLHEGKGYESRPIEELLALLREGRDEMLSRLRELSPDDWLKTGHIFGMSFSVLDFGRWAANHNIGHAAQIRRRLGAGE